MLAPVIRDLGMTLAMRARRRSRGDDPARADGQGRPADAGKDLHTGDFAWGVLPAAAPLAVGSLSMAGMAMAFWRAGRRARRVVVHRRRRLLARRMARSDQPLRRAKLPAIFCLQNNQTALSTPVRDNSAARVFADKALGYGIPGITIDGTDPDEVAAAFTWAAERARAGEGPTLIEVVAMRMCGHAHHDDMLYLGKDQPPSWEYRRCTTPATPIGSCTSSGRSAIRLRGMPRGSKTTGRSTAGHLDDVKKWADELVDRAGAARDRRAVAEAGTGRHRRVQGRSAARARRSARAVAARRRRRSRRRCRRSSRVARSTRRATRCSKR